VKLNYSTGSFELLIKGYNRRTAHWRERNSLSCELLTHSQKTTHRQLAALQTWELKRLIDGLKLVWNRTVGHQTMTFAEPGLSVDATAMPNQHYQVAVQLDHALAPSWHPYPDFPLQLNSLLTHQQLSDAIQDLTQQLALFPER
jgi:hypothetical protein